MPHHCCYLSVSFQILLDPKAIISLKLNIDTGSTLRKRYTVIYGIYIYSQNMLVRSQCKTSKQVSGIPCCHTRICWYLRYSTGRVDTEC
jgi:hypothetical protein